MLFSILSPMYTKAPGCHQLIVVVRRSEHAILVLYRRAAVHAVEIMTLNPFQRHPSTTPLQSFFRRRILEGSLRPL